VKFNFLRFYEYLVENELDWQPRFTAWHCPSISKEPQHSCSIAMLKILVIMVKELSYLQKTQH